MNLAGKVIVLTGGTQGIGFGHIDGLVTEAQWDRVIDINDVPAVG